MRPLLQFLRREWSRRPARLSIYVPLALGVGLVAVYLVYATLVGPTAAPTGGPDAQQPPARSTVATTPIAGIEQPSTAPAAGSVPGLSFPDIRLPDVLPALAPPAFAAVGAETPRESVPPALVPTPQPRIETLPSATTTPGASIAPAREVGDVPAVEEGLPSEPLGSQTPVARPPIGSTVLPFARVLPELATEPRRPPPAPTPLSAVLARGPQGQPRLGIGSASPTVQGTFLATPGRTPARTATAGPAAAPTGVWRGGFVAATPTSPALFTAPTQPPQGVTGPTFIPLPTVIAPPLGFVGFGEPQELGGRVFQDLPPLGSESADGSEPGLANWQIRGFPLSGDTCMTAFEVARAVTGRSGEWRINSVGGALCLVEDSKAGWTQTFPDGPEDGVFSAGDGTWQGKLFTSSPLAPGLLSFNFGNVPAPSAPTAVPTSVVPNDNFASAFAMNVPDAVVGTTLDATVENGEPATRCDATDGASVWFKFQPAVSGPVVAIVIAGGQFTPSFNPTLSLFTGSSPATLSEVACAAGTFSGLMRLQAEVAAATSYYLRIAGHGGQMGNYTLILTPPPANDAFARAQPITVPSTTTGSTAGASNEVGELGCQPASPGFAGDGTSVWFQLRPTTTGTLVASTSGSAFANMLALYSAAATLAELGPPICGSQDSPSGFGGAPPAPNSTSLIAPVTAGRLYYLRLAGTGDTMGSYTLQLSVSAATLTPTPTPTPLVPFECPTATPVLPPGSFFFCGLTPPALPTPAVTLIPAQANDSFANAFALTLPTTVGGSNIGATIETGEPMPSCVRDGASVWFRFVPSASGAISITTLSSLPGTGPLPLPPDVPFNTTLALYTGSSLTTLSEVACNNDVAPGPFSEINANVTAGTTYHVRVAGDPAGTLGLGQTGLYVLRITSPRTTNDSFTNAQVLTLPDSVTGSTRLATTEPGEPRASCAPDGASVWFRFTPSSSGTITADTSAGPFAGILPFDTTLTLYTGSSLTSLTEVRCNDDDSFGGPTSRLSAIVTAGTTHYLRLAGYLGLTGPYVLNVTAPIAPPANDNFANAQVLSVPGTANGTNRGATDEAGERSSGSCGFGDTASVWFRLQPGSSGMLTADATGSIFPSLTLYTGPSLSTLVEVACGTFPPTFTQDPTVRLQAAVHSGTIYHLRLASPGGTGTTGTFNLQVSLDSSASGGSSSAIPTVGATANSLISAPQSRGGKNLPGAMTTTPGTLQLAPTTTAATPTPTATPPAPTPTATPTSATTPQTPVPSSTPTPTATIAVGSSTYTPTPTPSAMLTPNPNATSTPSPTQTLVPTRSPGPTATPTRESGQQ